MENVNLPSAELINLFKELITIECSNYPTIDKNHFINKYACMHGFNNYTLEYWQNVAESL